MNVFITGGLGFLGSHIASALLKRKYSVTLFDVSNLKESPASQVLTEEEIASVRIISGDVEHFIRLYNVLNNSEADCVVHLAAMVGLQAETSPDLATAVNCAGTLNVFEAARMLRMRRVVFPSTNRVLGPEECYPSKIIGDDVPHFPSSVYGSTKSYCEYMSRHYYKHFGLDVIVLRLAPIYGFAKISGMGGEFTDNVRKVALGQAVTLPGDEFVDGYVYIKDIAEAFVQACIIKQTKGRVFNTHGINQYHTFKEIAGVLQKINPESKVTIDSIKSKGSIFPTTSNDAIQKELNWAPRYSLYEGLREMVNLFRSQENLTNI